MFDKKTLSFLTGKTDYGGNKVPQKSSSQPGKSTADTLYGVRDFLQGKADYSTPNISLSIDPGTNDIVVNAPDYYLASQEYKTQLLPLFQQLAGSSIDDIQASALLSNDTIKGMQKQAEQVRKRMFQTNQVRKIIGENASESDAMLALRNAGAAFYNDDDTENFVTTGVDKNGEEMYMSVADTIKDIKSFSPEGRAKLFKSYMDIANNENLNAKQRSMGLGMANFMLGKNLTDPGTAMKWGAGVGGFAAGALDAGAGVVNFIPKLFGRQVFDANYKEQVREAAEEAGVTGTVYRDRDTGLIVDKNDSNAVMGFVAPGVKGSLTFGEAFGDISAAFVPLPGPGKITGVARALGAARAAPKAAQAAQTAVALERSFGPAKATQILLQTGGARGVAEGGSVIRGLNRVDRALGQNLLYGVSQAGQKDLGAGVQELAIGAAADMMLAAAFRGAGRGIGEAAVRLDPNKYPTTAEFNAAVSEVVQRVHNKITDLPGIKHARRITDGAVDSLNPIRRKVQQKRLADATRGRGTALSRLDDNMLADNIISDKQKKGQATVEQFLSTDGRIIGTKAQGAKAEYTRVVELEAHIDNIAKETPETAEAYRQYILDRMAQNNIDNGRGVYSKADKERIADSIARFEDDELAETYWDAYNELHARFQDWRAVNGIRNADDLAMMRETTFKDGFIHMQKNLDPSGWKKKFTAKQIKKIEEAYGIKGGSTLDMASPLETINDYVYATGRLIADNNFNRLIGNLVGSGAISGRVVRTGKLSRAAEKLDIIRKGEKAALQEISDKTITELGLRIGRAVEDMTDIYNPRAAEALHDTINSAIDELAETIAKDPRYADLIARISQDLPDLDNPGYIAALEIIANKRGAVDKAMLSALNKPLSASDAGEVANVWSNQLTDKIRLNRAQASGRTVEVTDELGKPFSRTPETAAELPDGRIESPTNAFKERQEAWKTVKTELGEYNKNAPNLVTWYDEGGIAAAEVNDPEIIRWMNRTTKTQAEKGFAMELFELQARAFRWGTTGGNPAFNFIRNPIRDSLQSFIGQGAGVLSPKTNADLMIGVLPENKANELRRQLQLSYQGQSRGTFLQQGAADVAAAPMRNLRREQANTLREKTVAAWDNFTDSTGWRHKTSDFLTKVERIMSISEPALRNRNGSIAFAKAIERGANREVAEQAAIWAARETTTNFANKGAWLESWSAGVPYLTASINGPASFVRLMKADPIGVSSRLVLGVSLPTMLLTMSNMQDEDTASAYLDFPEWDRRNNLIVMFGPDNFVRIPLPYEAMPLINPLQDVVERMYGLDKNNFDIISDAFIGASPIDLSGFSEKAGLDGDGINWGMGASRLASQLLPQALKAPAELISGRSLYTGNNLRMTDDEMIERGIIDPDADISRSDRSLSGWNSGLLGAIADKVGIDQFVLQNIVKNYGGSTAEQLIGTIDAFGSGVEERKKGKNFANTIANTLFGKPYSQSDVDFWSGYNKLQSQKASLETKLDKINQGTYGDEAAQYEAHEQSNALKTEFGEKVADFSNKYGKMYERVGGVDPRKLNSLVNLLTFYPSRTDSGTWQAGQIDDVSLAAQSAGRQLASDVGLPDSNQRDRYGRLVQDELGEFGVDFGRTSRATGDISTRYYDAPKQAAYEFEQVFKANKKDGLPSMNDIWYNQWKPEIDKLYKQAEGLKGPAAQAIYDQIHALQEGYMAEVFDPRVQPLIEKWGPGVLTNRSITDKISQFIQIPGNFTPFHSKKKTPYLTRDTRAYIMDRYGVGSLSQVNKPTSAEAQQMIRRINTDIENGNAGAASFRFDRLQKDIEAGNMFVDNDTMNYISSLLNKRR